MFRPANASGEPERVNACKNRNIAKMMRAYFHGFVFPAIFLSRAISMRPMIIAPSKLTLTPTAVPISG